MKKPSRTLIGIVWLIFFISILLILDDRYNGERALLNRAGLADSELLSSLSEKFLNIFKKDDPVMVLQEGSSQTT